MAFKLNKEENATRSDLVARLAEAHTELEEVIAVANEAIEEALVPVNEKVEAYNAVLQEAKEFAEEVAGRFQEEFDEKTEKWQDGEKGTAASELISHWTEMDFEDIEEIKIDPIDDPDLDHSESLDTAPGEIE